MLHKHYRAEAWGYGLRRSSKTLVATRGQDPSCLLMSSCAGTFARIKALHLSLQNPHSLFYQ